MPPTHAPQHHGHHMARGGGPSQHAGPAMRQRQRANARPQRNPRIHGRRMQRQRDRRHIGGQADQPRRLRRAEAPAGHAPQHDRADGDGAGHRAVQHLCRQRQHREGQHDARAADRQHARHAGAVGQVAAQARAQCRKAADQEQHDAHMLRREAQPLHKERCDVGVERKAACGPQRGHRQRAQHAGPARHAQALRQRGYAVRQVARQTEGEPCRGQRREHPACDERRAPVALRGNPRAQRHTERHRHRAATRDDGQRRAAARGRHQRGRHRIGRRQKDAGRQRQQHARRHQLPKAVRGGRQQVACRKDGQRADQHASAVHIAEQRRHHRRAHGIGDGKHGDELPSRRHAHAQVCGQHRQQTGDHEPFSADGERAQAQPPQRCRHGRLLSEEESGERGGAQRLREDHRAVELAVWPNSTLRSSSEMSSRRRE